MLCVCVYVAILMVSIIQDYIAYAESKIHFNTHIPEPICIVHLESFPVTRYFHHAFRVL